MKGKNGPFLLASKKEKKKKKGPSTIAKEKRQR